MECGEDDRPSFHVMPRRGWLNDPNGVIFYKGNYHLFYQHVESGCEWNWGLVWGHAVSCDLVTWRHLPPALRPTPGSPDADGCWSGCCALNRDGTPVLLYTGVRLRSNPDCGPPPPPDQDLGLFMIESQCAAVLEDPDDDLLLHWRKLPSPILPLPPPGLRLTGWRDPFIVDPASAEDGHYTMILGSGFKEEGGALLAYRSMDLLQGWEYLGTLCRGSGAGTPGGSVWECPLLIPLPDPESEDPILASPGNQIPSKSDPPTKWLLAVSPFPAIPPHAPTNPVLYWTGALSLALPSTPAAPSPVAIPSPPPSCPKFSMSQANGPFRFDLGDLLYAPNACKTDQGRWLLWGWVQERRRAGVYSFAGCLTVPRLISAGGEGGRVAQEPAPQVARLRCSQPSWRAAELAIDPERGTPVLGPPLPAMDLTVQLHRQVPWGDSSTAGLLFESFGAEAGGDAALLVHWEEWRVELRFGAGLGFGRGTADTDGVLAELASPLHPYHVSSPEGPGGGGPADALSPAPSPPGSPPPSRPPIQAELAPPVRDVISLRILLDHSCLEVFTGRGQALTSRLYRGSPPPGTDHSGVCFVSMGGGALARELCVWEMRSCWSDKACSS